MKHKRQLILTTVFTLAEFEQYAYSVRLFSGLTFINLKAGRFAYQEDLTRQISVLTAYQKARTVTSLNGRVIAKRKNRAHPLQHVHYRVI